MPLPKECVLLRIFVGEKERSGHAPLYESIVLKAREAGMAGATVLRGPMGFGLSRRIHTNKILDLSEDLPMVIEIVDTPEKIDAFLETIDPMMSGGLITFGTVSVIQYGS